MVSFKDWNDPKVREEINVRAKMGAAACREAIAQSQAEQPYRELYVLGGNSLNWLLQEFSYLKRDAVADVFADARNLSAGTFDEKITFVSGEHISELPFHYIVRKGDENFAKNFAKYLSDKNSDCCFAQDNARRTDDGTLPVEAKDADGMLLNTYFTSYSKKQYPIILFTDKTLFEAAKQHLGIQEKPNTPICKP